MPHPAEARDISSFTWNMFNQLMKGPEDFTQFIATDYHWVNTSNQMSVLGWTLGAQSKRRMLRLNLVPAYYLFVRVGYEETLKTLLKYDSQLGKRVTHVEQVKTVPETVTIEALNAVETLDRQGQLYHYCLYRLQTRSWPDTTSIHYTLMQDVHLMTNFIAPFPVWDEIVYMKLEAVRRNAAGKKETAWQSPVTGVHVLPDGRMRPSKVQFKLPPCVYFDIETMNSIKKGVPFGNHRGDQLLSMVVYYEREGTTTSFLYLPVKNEADLLKLPQEWRVFRTEKEMVIACMKLLLDPYGDGQCCTLMGWNIGYDIKFLLHMCLRYNLPEANQVYYTMAGGLQMGMNTVTIDLFEYFQTKVKELPGFSLKVVTNHFLPSSQAKLEEDTSSLAERFNVPQVSLQHLRNLIKYNARDVVCLDSLTTTVRVQESICRMSTVQFLNVTNVSQAKMMAMLGKFFTFDGLQKDKQVLRNHPNVAVIPLYRTKLLWPFNPKSTFGNSESYTGGFNYCHGRERKPIVQAADIKSAYPSLIASGYGPGQLAVLSGPDVDFWRDSVDDPSSIEVIRFDDHRPTPSADRETDNAFQLRKDLLAEKLVRGIIPYSVPIPLEDFDSRNFEDPNQLWILHITAERHMGTICLIQGRQNAYREALKEATNKGDMLEPPQKKRRKGVESNDVLASGDPVAIYVENRLMKVMTAAVSGCQGSDYGILRSPESGPIITFCGRNTIIAMASEMNRLGHHVLFCDTDSVFVDMKSKAEMLAILNPFLLAFDGGITKIGVSTYTYVLILQKKKYIFQSKGVVDTRGMPKNNIPKLMNVLKRQSVYYDYAHASPQAFFQYLFEQLLQLPAEDFVFEVKVRKHQKQFDDLMEQFPQVEPGDRHKVYCGFNKNRGLNLRHLQLYDSSRKLRHDDINHLDAISPLLTTLIPAVQLSEEQLRGISYSLEELSDIAARVYLQMRTSPEWASISRTTL